MNMSSPDRSGDVPIEPIWNETCNCNADFGGLSMHGRLAARTSLLAMRGKLGLVAVAGLAAALVALPITNATANVIYHLQESLGGFTGTLTVPNVISTTTTFPISAFTGVSSNPEFYTSAEFAVTSTSDGITLFDSVGFSPYTFPVGTFETNGTSTDHTDFRNLTLTVSGVPIAVAEPTTVALLGGSLLLLGLFTRRGRGYAM